MRLEVAAAGRPRTVELRRTSGETAVLVDGRERAVSVARVGHGWSLLVGPPEGGPHDSGGPHDRQGSDRQYVGAGLSRPGKSYEVSVVEHRRGELTVHVNGRAVPVVVASGKVRLKPDTPHAGGPNAQYGVSGFSRTDATGPQRIVAPMPGRIVKLLVKVGDVVVARQGLVVVEAMKMENELRAPRAGTITEVKVAEGASVEAQAVLVVLE